MTPVDIAMMTQDLHTLILSPNYVRARNRFREFEYLIDRYGLVQRATDLTYIMSGGGRIKFGHVGDEYEPMKYLGTEWQNVLCEGLEPELRMLCVQKLFKPIYRGNQNVV